MIIINADDWGRSVEETDAALACYAAGRITSVTAMVFMEDSSRAAELAKQSGLEVGLHLNLDQAFSAEVRCAELQECQGRVRDFLTRSRFSQITYSPALRTQFRYVYKAQYEEFVRLYGRPPSHIDGHHHKHLCTNMLVGRIIAEGTRVRRSFSYWPGEKSLPNRAYRRVVDRVLAGRYRIADYLFSLTECLRHDRLARVMELAGTAAVELMTHPANPGEYSHLMGDEFLAWLAKLQKGTYSRL